MNVEDISRGVQATNISA